MKKILYTIAGIDIICGIWIGIRHYGDPIALLVAILALLAGVMIINTAGGNKW